MGIHHVATLHYLLGSMDHVRGSFTHLSTHSEINDGGVDILEYKQGTRAVLTVINIFPRTFFIRFYCSKGNLKDVAELSDWRASKMIDSMTTLTSQKKDSREEVTFTPNDMLVDELEGFAYFSEGRLHLKQAQQRVQQR